MSCCINIYPPARALVGSGLKPRREINLFLREKEKPVELKRDDHRTVCKHMEKDPERPAE